MTVTGTWSREHNIPASLQLASLVVARTTPPEELAAMRHLFESLDTDSTGTISYEKLHKGLDEKCHVRYRTSSRKADPIQPCLYSLLTGAAVDQFPAMLNGWTRRQAIALTALPHRVSTRRQPPFCGVCPETSILCHRP